MYQKLIFLGAILGLASCAPTVTVEPIAPRAVVVREAAKVVTKKSESVQTAVRKSHTEATGLVVEADNLVAETERLKNSSGVTPDDLDALWMLATTLSTHAKIHGDTNRVAVAVAEDLHVSAVEHEASTTELAKVATATDQQTTTLKQKAESLREDAAFGKSVKWIIGGVLLLLLVVFIVVPIIRRASPL